jgi:hypothetical protein
MARILLTNTLLKLIRKKNMTSFRKFLATAVVMASCFYATSASANLVTNGDFETGDTTGWGSSAAGSNYVDTAFDGYTVSGNYALFMGCVRQLCGNTQTIATTAGATYNFSFDYGSDGRIPNQFIANFGGVTVFSTLNDTTSTQPGFAHESFILTATGPATLIEFLGRNDPTWQALDNVSVMAVPTPG